MPTPAILDYPGAGYSQYGFYQLQISGADGVNDVGGDALSDRVQAVPVTFTPPSPGSPVTIYPDSYGCVFAELSPTVTSQLTTALTLGQTGMASLAVSTLTVPITAGESIGIGSGATMQTVTARSQEPAWDRYRSR